MFYKLTQGINISLSCLFLVIGIGASITVNRFSAEVFIGISFIIVYTIVLLFSFNCYKINKCNKEKILIPKQLRNTGKVLFVFILLSSLYIFFCSIAAFAAFKNFASLSNLRQWPFYLAFLLLLTLSAVTGIFSLILFSRSLRNNKSLVNEFINNIGHKTESN